jgi:hypothetical protein
MSFSSVNNVKQVLDAEIFALNAALEIIQLRLSKFYICLFSEVSRFYESELECRGVSSERRASLLKNSTFKKKVEKHFGKSITFISDEHHRLLILASNLSVHDLALEQMRIMKDLEKRKQQCDDFIKKAALHLREKIKIFAKEIGDIDMTEECLHLPPSVEEFFLTVLCGEKRADPSDRVKRLSVSFSQDLINDVTRGKIKMPEHVLLPHAIKTLTGNVELVTLVNRLGHGLSYHKLEEIETSIAIQKLLQLEHQPFPYLPP